MSPERPTPAKTITSASTRVSWIVGHLATSLFLIVATAGLVVGGMCWLVGADSAASGAWAATTLLGVVFGAWWVIDAARHRRLGVDVIALLALAGALIVGELLAGAVISVMLATGRTLEAWAQGRADRELRALSERAPRVAHRYDGGQLVTVDPEDVAVGDLLLVGSGEMVPVDGIVIEVGAVVDESALTGESRLVERLAGETVRSGGINAGAPFDLRATTDATSSTYAGLVRLVGQASASSAPFVRQADRYAVVFLLASLGLAGVAWLASGQLARAVDVLVVATPCPLILAAPVAFVAGLSRAAQRGVVVKGGAVLERLASADTLLFDKTGTLTVGRPIVREVLAEPGHDPDTVLRLAASLDQVSSHVLADALVRSARERGLTLFLPTRTEEIAGSGARGTVEGHLVAVGKRSWVCARADHPWPSAARPRPELEGSSTVHVGVDREPAGVILLGDPVRPDARRTVRSLRRAGIRRVVMASGDRRDAARAVGDLVGVDEVLAELTPAEKVAAVARESEGHATIMVGDGIDDVPALAAATVGVAMGATGSAASSEAADVVLTVDRLDRLGEAHVIARRTRRIAAQSVVAGIALSLVAMLVAAFGYLPAAWGALLQEVIDVAVILNALRALGGGDDLTHLAPEGNELALRFSAEHLELRPEIELLRTAADALADEPGEEAMHRVRRAHHALVVDIEPHEQAEDRQLYPAVADALGGTDPTGPMSRTHTEITGLTARLTEVLGRLDDRAPTPDEVLELRRLLYGLYAVLELHFSQEEESYLSLAEEAAEEDRR